MDLKNYNRYKKLFNLHSNKLINKNFDNLELIEMIKYALNDGKYLRPIIAMSMCIETGAILPACL